MKETLLGVLGFILQPNLQILVLLLAGVVALLLRDSVTVTAIFAVTLVNSTIR